MEHGEQHQPPPRREPVGHASLLAQEVKAQLTHLPLQVAGVRLAEGLGLLGEKADQEVDATKVPIGQGLQPYADL